jgi:hypothetical protein
MHSLLRVDCRTVGSSDFSKHQRELYLDVRKRIIVINIIMCLVCAKTFCDTNAATEGS